MFIMDIGLKFSFLVESLPGFGIRMMLVSENELVLSDIVADHMIVYLEDPIVSAPNLLK